MRDIYSNVQAEFRESPPRIRFIIACDIREYSSSAVWGKAFSLHLLEAPKEDKHTNDTQASHAISISRPSLCWILTSQAASLAQSVGYHRVSTMVNDPPEIRERKVFLFWFIYMLDKSLSLRLGRAASIQDFDISLPLPTLSGNLKRDIWPRMHAMWIKLATIQGRMYEELYSPRALKDGEVDRTRKARLIADDIEALRGERREVSFCPILFPACALGCNEHNFRGAF